MADRLNGYRILILETREEAQFSRLLTEQGADVLQCPMFTIQRSHRTRRRSKPGSCGPSKGRWTIWCC